MSDVEVYYFTGWDQMQGDNLLSKRSAMLEAIKARGGTHLPETRRVVDSSELDGNGVSFTYSSQAGCVELSDPNCNFVTVTPFRPAALR